MLFRRPCGVTCASRIPKIYKQLYNSAHFLENIRAYNQIFSMTSLGAKLDKSVNIHKTQQAIHLAAGCLGLLSWNGLRILTLVRVPCTESLGSGKLLTLQPWRIDPLFSVVYKSEPLMLLLRSLLLFLLTVLVCNREEKKVNWLGGK